MEHLDEAPATGATPTIVTKLASEHLGSSIDDALQRQRRTDLGTLAATLVCAALTLIGVGLLLAYTVGGRW